jgi:23S rRNA-/tRNA-specific pseudouridylate synthase
MTEPPSAAGAPFVLHRDRDLLVLYKPTGLPTTRPDDGPCLVRWAEALDPKAPRLHASSRLDAEVTGLVTFARSQRAIQALLEARRAGRYERFYLGISAAAPEPAEGEWRWAIAQDPRDPRRRVALAPDDARGARSLTRYRVQSLQPLAAVLALRPETGRTHQLRVHAARAGVPLLGDRHYGGEAKRVLADGRVLRASRVMLHCARVRLPAIAGGEPLTIDAPVPDDMHKLWRELGGAPECLESGSVPVPLSSSDIPRG